MYSIVIPARYESETLSILCASLLGNASEIIVVVNRDDIETLEVIPNQVRVVFEDRAGKGYAMRTGALSASQEIIVFMDADLSHSPKDINRLIEPIVNNDADHVVGSRMLGGSSELFYELPQFIRLCGSHIITLAINRKFGTKLTDSQNGFRAIRRKLFLSLDLTEKHTTIEQEMTVKSILYGARMLEVPSHEYARAGGESKIKVWKHGWRYVIVLMKFLITCPSMKSGSYSFANHSKYNAPWYERNE